MHHISHIQHHVLVAKSISLAKQQPTYRSDLLIQGPQSRSFLLDSGVFGGFPAPGAARQVILTYRVPPVTLAVISQLAIIANGPDGFFTDGSGAIIWRMFNNGAAVKGMQEITAQIGTIEQPVPWWMVLRPNDVLTITVEVPAGQQALAAGSVTAARLYGYLDSGVSSNNIPGFPGSIQSRPGASPAAPSAPAAGAPVSQKLARRFRH
jgi:hypothetical protein